MWQTVFDLRRDGTIPWWALLSLLYFLPLAVLLYLPFRRPSKTKRRKNPFWWLDSLAFSGGRIRGFALLLVLLVVYFFCESLKLSIHAWMAYDDLRAGTYQVVEGRVRHYVPKRFAQDRDESFDVNGVAFIYAGTDDAIGYNRTYYQGSPIREGSLVRIAYTGNFILRLQIAP